MASTIGWNIWSMPANIPAVGSVGVVVAEALGGGAERVGQPLHEGPVGLEGVHHPAGAVDGQRADGPAR